MRVQRTLIFVLLFFYAVCTHAQQERNPADRVLDSLKAALLVVKHDSGRVRLQCLIGRKAAVARLPFWDSLLTGARKYNLPLSECIVLTTIGRIYGTRNEPVKALDYLDKSMSLARAHGYRSEMILILDRMIALYTGKTSVKKFLDLCYEGVRIAEDLGDKRAAVDFYSRIASYYFFTGDIRKALDVHFKCLRISEELNYSLGIASALADIGSDYHALGDEKNTVKYYLEIRKYTEEFSKTVYGAYIYNTVASAYEINHQPDSALKYSFISNAISRKYHESQSEASSLVVIAKALFQKGDVQGAEQKALEAKQLAQSIGFTVQLPDLALFLKTLYLKKGQYKKALEVYELYVTAKDSVSNEKNREQSLQREFAYTFEKKENENKMLAQQNKIQSLQLIGLGGLLMVVMILAYLVLKQNRIRTEQKSLRLEQKLLRSQMNPHFIFNSLNSIQQFVISRQNGQAERYLSRFASLIRELLESNIKENISLREEISILQGYLEMETLRFKNSFSFTIHVDELLDPECIFIPHMMIQPLVENAIWHGLLPKAGERSLQITFGPGPARTIQCVIDDNGVGRVLSAKRIVPFKRKSLALGFIQQRMELMRKTLKVQGSVKIIDKLSGTGVCEGTKVILMLPLVK